MSLTGNKHPTTDGTKVLQAIYSLTNVLQGIIQSFSELDNQSFCHMLSTHQELPHPSDAFSNIPKNAYTLL
jgi:hypothetical protein